MGYTRQVEGTYVGTGSTAVEDPQHYVDIQLGSSKPPSTELLPTKKIYSLQYNNVNLAEFMEVAFIIVLWYATSSLANNLNKSILDDLVFPFPFTLTYCQFGFIALYCFASVQIWPRSFKLQKFSFKFLSSIVVPLCVSQIIAHLLTQLSLQHVPVSFTHTVKGCSPIFAIILSKYYHFNDRYSWTLFASIVAIIMGVVLSSFNEINFKFFGFITALGSTLVFSWQNAFSKKIFRDNEMDEVNLLFYTATFAFCLMTPVWLVVDLPNIFVYVSTKPDSTSGLTVAFLFFLNGICHFGQNITAFTFMTRVTPLTYTVFNTFKRTFVIISSILYFGNSVSFLNAVGIALTTAGVALYNKAKLDMRGKE